MNYFITGNAHFCYTTKVNTNGKFPSLCYEVGINNNETEFVFDGDESHQVISKYIKRDKSDKFDYLKIANSKFGFNMFDLNKQRIEPIAIPNGTRIKLAVTEKHSEKYNSDYLVCVGIQILEPIPENNPFK